MRCVKSTCLRRHLLTPLPEGATLFLKHNTSPWVTSMAIFFRKFFRNSTCFAGLIIPGVFMLGSCSLKKKWTIVSKKMNDCFNKKKQCFKKSNHWRKKKLTIEGRRNKKGTEKNSKEWMSRAQSICQWSVAVTWVGLISPSATKDCPAVPWCWFRRSRRCYMFGKSTQNKRENISDHFSQLYLYLK